MNRALTQRESRVERRASSRARGAAATSKSGPRTLLGVCTFRVWISEKKRQDFPFRSRTRLFARDTTCARSRSGVRDRRTFLPLMSRLARWKKRARAARRGDLGRRLRDDAVRISRNLTAISPPRFQRTNSRSWWQQSTENEQGKGGREGKGPAGDYCLL